MSLSSDLSIRVHTLMAKTRSKLSLNKPRPTLKYFYFLSFLSRFENNFTQFKQLKTFVSSQKQIEKLNPLNNQELLKQLRKYFVQQKLKKLSKQPNRGLINQIEQDQFYQELDYENERDRHFAETINFGRAANLNPRKSIDIDQYIKAKSVIRRATYKNINRSLPELDIQRKTKFNTQPQSNFYDSIQQTMKDQEERYLDQDLKDFEQQELEAIENSKLEEIARQFGLTDEENMENQIMRSYRKRSNIIIKNNIEESRRIYEDQLNVRRFEERIRKPTKMPFIKLRNQELHEKMKNINNECKNKIFKQPFNEQIDQLEDQFIELSNKADFNKQKEQLNFGIENQKRIAPGVKSKFTRMMEKKQQRVMRILKYQN